MEVESEKSYNVENDIAYKRYLDEEPELDPIKRTKLDPQCIIDSDFNCEGENRKVIKQEPQSIDLTESCENGQFSNFKDGSGETSRKNTTLDDISNIYVFSNNTNLNEMASLFRGNTVKSPEIGADVSDTVQNLMQSRQTGISPLQCSECDLVCPSLPELEFHTKLHVMERIALQNSNAKTKTLNQQNSFNEKSDTHIDEASNIETIMESLVSREASEETSHSNFGSGYSGERPHKCDECGFRFTSTTHLKRHMLTHTGDKPFTCTECDYRCARNDKLKIHMQLHNTGQNSSKENNYTHIDVASDIVTIMESLVSREASEETSLSNSGSGYSGERPHKCDECGFRFTSTTHLKRHMLIHTGDKPYTCTECDYRCARNDKLKIHMQSHITGPKLFACTECDYSSGRKDKLKNHMKTHITRQKLYASTDFGTKRHECPLCDYKCNDKGNLAKHLVIHGDDKPFSCPAEGCDYKCKLKCNLKTHILKHSGEKPYVCHICDYRSFVKGDLTSHMFKHSGEKTFSCPEEGCDYKCNLKCNLKSHILKHSGEKRYACNLCDYRSFTKGDLTTHMFKHSGEKPFPCSVCGNRYAVKGDLNVHMRIHTNNKKFKCQQCDYSCFTQQRVDQHMLTHTGEKPHKCDECGFRFTNTSNLKRHMRIHTEKTKSEFLSQKPNEGSPSTDTTTFDNPVGSHGILGSQLPNDLPHHSEVSNASSQGHQTFHQGNTQPLNNQHILGSNDIMGRSSQETTRPDVDYKMYSNNMA